MDSGERIKHKWKRYWMISNWRKSVKSRRRRMRRRGLEMSREKRRNRLRI